MNSMWNTFEVFEKYTKMIPWYNDTTLVLLLFTMLMFVFMGFFINFSYKLPIQIAKYSFFHIAKVKLNQCIKSHSFWEIKKDGRVCHLLENYVDTGRKVNVHKTSSWTSYVRSTYVLCIRGKWGIWPYFVEFAVPLNFCTGVVLF